MKETKWLSVWQTGSFESKRFTDSHTIKIYHILLIVDGRNRNSDDWGGCEWINGWMDGCTNGRTYTWKGEWADCLIDFILLINWVIDFLCLRNFLDRFFPRTEEPLITVFIWSGQFYTIRAVQVLNFISGPIFTIALVVFVTAKIAFTFISWTAGHIYGFS